MDARKSLSSIISKKVKESPLASNIMMGLFLLVCEKMLDSEFLCPCSERREWNSLFVFLYFLCPGFTISVLMYHVHKHGSSSSCCLIFFHTSVPVLTWLIILFLDGEYVACGMTNWSGVYEVSGGGLMRWCEPDKNTSERLSYTRTAYTISQSIGLLLCIPFGLIVSYCLKNVLSKINQEGTNLELLNLRVESASTDQIPS